MENKSKTINNTTSPDKISHFFKNPLFHFLLIGTIIYAFYGFFVEKVVTSEESTRTITIKQSEIVFMIDTWQKQWNRPPSEEERASLINSYIRELVFFRVAKEMGLDKDDVVIRRLLVQKLQFITNDLIKPQEPAESELERYYKENIEKYSPPEFISITQIFFDPDKRDDSTLKNAEMTMNLLKQKDISSINPGEYGDQIMLQNYYPQRTERELAKFFGLEFARSLFKLETGKWSGPVLSGYGTHIVYVHDRQKADPPDFTAVRESVLRDWMQERQKELNELYYQNLLERYEVVIEETGPAKVAEKTPEES